MVGETGRGPFPSPVWAGGPRMDDPGVAGAIRRDGPSAVRVTVEVSVPTLSTLTPSPAGREIPRFVRHRGGEGRRWAPSTPSAIPEEKQRSCSYRQSRSPA